MKKIIEKTETEILTNSGSPEKMSFEDMKKNIAEYKRLQKLIKALPKEDRAKLLPRRVREVSDQIKPMIEEVGLALVRNEKVIVSEFEKTITTEKPNGQKWLTWKLPNYTFCLMINKKKD